MADFLTTTVTARTALPAQYRENAAWQSMEVYLNDWHLARARLDRQIAELTVMVAHRKHQVRRGEWPTSSETTRPVSDLDGGESPPGATGHDTGHGSHVCWTQAAGPAVDTSRPSLTGPQSIAPRWQDGQKPAGDGRHFENQGEKP